jgi:hypothetical protein
MSARVRLDEVLRFLEIEDEAWIVELREEGFFATEEISAEEADELRVTALLVRELGVNAAGAEVILHLRRRLLCLESRMREALRMMLDEGAKR